MARFIPAALIGLTAVGLLIGGVSPAWWITALAAVGFALVLLLADTLSLRGRFTLHLSQYIPAVLIGLTAVGFLIAGASPAWWITALVAVGFVLVVFMAQH